MRVTIHERLGYDVVPPPLSSGCLRDSADRRLGLRRILFASIWTLCLLSHHTDMSHGALLMRSLCDLDTVAHVQPLCLALRFGRLFSVPPLSCLVNLWSIDGESVEQQCIPEAASTADPWRWSWRGIPAPDLGPTEGGKKVRRLAKENNHMTKVTCPVASCRGVELHAVHRTTRKVNKVSVRLSAPTIGRAENLRVDYPSPMQRGSFRRIRQVGQRLELGVRAPTTLGVAPSAPPSVNVASTLLMMQALRCIVVWSTRDTIR